MKGFLSKRSKKCSTACTFTQIVFLFAAATGLMSPGFIVDAFVNDEIRFLNSKSSSQNLHRKTCDCPQAWTYSFAWIKMRGFVQNRLFLRRYVAFCQPFLLSPFRRTCILRIAFKTSSQLADPVWACRVYSLKCWFTYFSCGTQKIGFESIWYAKTMNSGKKSECDVVYENMKCSKSECENLAFEHFYEDFR